MPPLLPSRTAVRTYPRQVARLPTRKTQLVGAAGCLMPAHPTQEAWQVLPLGALGAQVPFSSADFTDLLCEIPPRSTSRHVQRGRCCCCCCCCCLAATVAIGPAPAVVAVALAAATRNTRCVQRGVLRGGAVITTIDATAVADRRTTAVRWNFHTASSRVVELILARAAPVTYAMCREHIKASTNIVVGARS